MKYMLLILLFVLMSIHQTIVEGSIPLVLNTWSFTDPTIAAWETVFYNNLTAVDGLVDGCTVCETDVAHCGLSVGYGGNPNELGDTQLDAMIMDGLTMNTGAVGGIRNIRNAIRVARHVLENTRHSLLVGREATQFAVQMGFKLETTKTNGSISVWNNWRNNTCQPNFWMNVSPDPSQSCGPFIPKPIELPLNETEDDSDVFKIEDKFYHEIGPDNHDTIGMIVIDKDNNLAAGTSTNGLRYKIPGRVGDSPIIGAGAYADNKIGAAVGTGNGDVMMRFLPSLLAVELMRSGLTPAVAAHRAIERIIPYYPAFSGAVLVTDKDGNYDAACHGMASFPFSVYTTETGNIMQSVACF